uniref:Uncharacterized protein n=1 Tax=Glossina palpalis gambiensis TaxID=67801 RepID=A0A1B0ALC9_9MUSC
MEMPKSSPLEISLRICKIYLTVASNESNANTATGSGGSGESTALFSKLRSFSIGSGPNSPQRVVSNLRGFLTTRLSNIAPGDT